RAFYALGDTQTPMRVSILCLSINFIFAVCLIGHYEAAGLGVANTLSGILNVGLLLYALRRKLARLELAELQQSFFAMLGAALCAGGVAWALVNFWNLKLGHATLWLKMGEVFLPMVIASAVY